MNKGVIYISISLVAIAAAYGYIHLSGASSTIDPNNPKMVDRGRQVYGLYCAECHGSKLEGESPNWRSQKEDGTLPAPPHDESGHTWHHSDELLFNYTKEGGAAMTPDSFNSAMPPFKNVLSDKEIRAVLSFIKSRWPKEIQVRQERLNQPQK